MQRSPIPFLAVAAIALLAAVGGGVAGAAFHAALDDEPETPQVVARDATPVATESGTVGDVYRRTYRSVVEITVSDDGEQEGPLPSRDRRSQGSGFVYDGEGHVVTNQHVVAGAETVSVTFWNGESYDARVVGSDRSTDLAVLDVDAPGSLLAPLELGESEELEIGDNVIAIGSPFGLEGTVTAGIVSALHRQMQAPNNFTINDSIQTDAAINHGNSGGPLLNMRGEVVGVNAQIRSDGGGNDGVGFAIPSDTVRSIVPQILEDGEVEHAYLGVTVVTIPSSAAEELDVPAGVAIAEVAEGGPAEGAKLRPSTGTRTVRGADYPTGGDVITEFDGEPVETTQELQLAVDAKRPGDTVTLTVVRGGESRTVRVELGERPPLAGE